MHVLSGLFNICHFLCLPILYFHEGYIIPHEQALHVAGQVAGTSVSTSPLPYGTMAGQCEALGMGTRKKLSSWLVGSHESMSDNPSPSLHMDEQKAVPKVT